MINGFEKFGQLIFGIFAALKKIFKHRVALWKAGRMLKVPIARLLRHDNSKFHPVEFIQYVKRFELGIIDDEAWAKAWDHHWRNNDHHMEYWLIKKNTRVIPEVVIREMIADWMAASYAYNGEWPKAPDWKWGNDNLVTKLDQIDFYTRQFAVGLLRKQGMITAQQVDDVFCNCYFCVNGLSGPCK